MKHLLLLLALALPAAAPMPPRVRVTFKPLTPAAYKQALGSSRPAKPRVTFPLKKRGGQLVIPTARGRQVFTDVVIDEAAVRKGHSEDESIGYAYLGYLPDLHCHLVHAQLYEIEKWLLLTDAGQQITLWGKPAFSPDNKAVAAACMGLEYAGGQPNSLRVLAMQSGKLQTIWHAEPTTWEPDTVWWASATTLLLRQRQWPSERRTYARLTIH